MTPGNTQSGAEMAQKKSTAPLSKLGRDHIDYWKARLFRRSYKHGGKTVEIPEFQIRLSYLGRREEFNLGTPNQATAASKARDIYRSLTGAGWDKTMAAYKPDMEISGDGCTVGQFLEQVQAISEKPHTFAIYARKFRTLVAGVCKIGGDDSKHDYRTGGYKAWLEKVHAVKLERLTPDRVKEWKLAQLKAAAADPLQQKHTSVTVRSIMLSSRSLFTVRADDGSREDVRKHITAKLPKVLPFDGVTLPKQGKSRYKGLGNNLTAALLWQAAQSELAKERPEEFKAYLLCFFAGLRRSEADNLEWAKIRWAENIVSVETTEHGRTKTDSSEADIDVDPEMLAILKKYMPKPGAKASKFVIESPIASRPGAHTYHHYRADRVFKNLINWLRSKGITARNPIHALRKECGSQICKDKGIYAASQALRHSSINLTREHYVSNDAGRAALRISALTEKKAA